MKRELLVYNIAGTDFIVDVDHLQLTEKSNAENVIPVLDMMDTGDGYEFDYSPKIKNMPSLFGDRKNIIRVKIPELVKLDPLGMAEKYGYPIETLQDKRDIDIMVNQEALKERLSGRLPTVDIMGLTFYVDTPMDMLRPKDDFLSNGIVFSQIEDYYDDEKDVYIIPYNPKTHEFQEMDYENLISIPRDLIPISFPHESTLDPVGFNRAIGLNETDGLKRTNLQSHFKVEVVDWKDTGIEQVIRKNIQQQQIRKQDLIQIKDDKPGRRQRKGPRL